MFADTLAIMQKAWRGESVVNDGDAVVLSPLPVQQPHPPLWVAAFGPKALAQTARLRLPYLASPMETLDTLAANYAGLAQPHVQVPGRDDAQSAAQRQPALDVPVMRTVFISERSEEVRRIRAQLQAAAQLLTVGALRREAHVQVADWAIIGTPEQALEQIAHYRSRIGMTHLIATRLRVPGVDGTLLRRSLVLLAGLRKQLS